jgi:hypothetical protein
MRLACLTLPPNAEISLAFRADDDSFSFLRGSGIKSSGVNGSCFFFGSRFALAITEAIRPARQNAASDPHGSLR